MFVALQVPFVDVRPFIQNETGRLTSPDWQSLQPDIDFVRSFGLVKRRLRGGVIEWPGEEMYCRALRALRFVNSNAKLPGDMGGGAPRPGSTSHSGDSLPMVVPWRDLKSDSDIGPRSRRACALGAKTSFR